MSIDIIDYLLLKDFKMFVLVGVFMIVGVGGLFIGNLMFGMVGFGVGVVVGVGVIGMMVMNCWYNFF